MSVAYACSQTPSGGHSPQRERSLCVLPYPFGTHLHKYDMAQKTPGRQLGTHIEVLIHSISDIQSEVLWLFY